MSCSAKHNSKQSSTDRQFFSGVQRSGNARGDYLIGCPLPNSSIEQWRMVVIVTGYTLFVTSHYDVILTFANQRFGEVCRHNVHIQGRRSSGKETVPSPLGCFEGLVPPNKAPKPIKLIMKHYKSVEFLPNFTMSRFPGTEENRPY